MTARIGKVCSSMEFKSGLKLLLRRTFVIAGLLEHPASTLN